MNFRRLEIFFISLSLLFLTGILSSATAKVMTVEDFNESYYGARIYDYGDSFGTSLYDISADGEGTRVEFNLIQGSLGSLATPYNIDERGMLTAERDVIQGAISPDGRYLAIGKFSDLHATQLLFAIKKSSGLSSTVVAGSYDVYLLYVLPGIDGGTIVDSTLGNFSAGGDVLSGNFAGEDAVQMFNGDYTIDYTVASDGRLTLSFVDGPNAAELGPMEGVISSDGRVFVAVDTTFEGARAYAVGIQRSNLNSDDLAGNYFVTDFGYFDMDSDGIRDAAAGSVMDFEAAADGTPSLSLRELFSTNDACLLETTGTFSAVAGNQFVTAFENPCDTKTGGPLLLAGEGNIFLMANPAYFGIGIPQASGELGPVTELTAFAGSDQVVEKGEEVTLDGSPSAAPDGVSIQSYAWEQTDGPWVELTPSQSEPAQASFFAPDVNTALTFKLTVNDDSGKTATDSVTVTVIDPDDQTQVPSSDENEGDGGGGGGGGDDSGCFIKALRN